MNKNYDCKCFIHLAFLKVILQSSPPWLWLSFLQHLEAVDGKLLVSIQHCNSNDLEFQIQCSHTMLLFSINVSCKFNSVLTEYKMQDIDQTLDEVNMYPKLYKLCTILKFI